MKKIDKVLDHLKKYGSITSWEAINEYGATRLSAIIFRLRYIGYDIRNEDFLFVDRYGDRNNFTRYVLYENNERVK